MTDLTWLDHTADAGLEIRAPDFSGLLEGCAEALYDLVCDRAGVAELLGLRMRLPPAPPEERLRYWLEELIFLAHGEALLLHRFQVRPAGGESADESTELTAEMYGEPADPVRHELYHEVKALTYHRYEVRRKAGLWTARFVFDL